MLNSTIRALSLATLLALGLAHPRTGWAGDGALDPAFSADGWYTFNDPVWNHEALDLAVDGQGRTLVSFLIPVDVGGGIIEPRAALIRLLPNGSLDASFGFLGFWFEQSLPARWESRVPVAVGPDGRIVVGWDLEIVHGGPIETDWYLRQLDSNGAVVSGRLIDFAWGSGDHNDVLYDLTVLWDNRTAAVGGVQYNGDDWDFGIALLTAAGFVKDATFDGDGLKTIPFDLGTAPWLYDVATAVVPYEWMVSIVVVGSAQTADGTHYAVARVLLDGSLDSTFSGDGKAHDGYSTLSGWVSTQNDAWAVSLGDSGQIHIAGDVLASDGGGGTQADAGVLCVDWTGAPCTGFGAANGWVSLDSTYPGTLGSSPNRALAIATDERGRLLVVGYVSGPGVQVRRATIHRLHWDGTRDSDFGVNGYAEFSFYPTAAAPRDGFRAVAATPGRILLAGGTRPHDANGVPRGDQDPIAVRLLNDSIFEDGFESGGLGAWFVP